MVGEVVLWSEERDGEKSALERRREKRERDAYLRSSMAISSNSSSSTTMSRTIQGFSDRCSVQTTKEAVVGDSMVSSSSKSFERATDLKESRRVGR